MQFKTVLWAVACAAGGGVTGGVRCSLDVCPLLLRITYCCCCAVCRDLSAARECVGKVGAEVAKDPYMQLTTLPSHLLPLLPVQGPQCCA
jgi:hypothetical protein